MNIGSIYIPPIGKRLIIGAIVAVTTLGIVSILKSRDVSLSDVRDVIGVGSVMTAISITFFSTSCILLNTVGLSIYKYSRFPERGLQLLNGMSFYNNHIGRITTILFISVAIASSLLALGEFSQ